MWGQNQRQPSIQQSNLLLEKLSEQHKASFPVACSKKPVMHQQECRHTCVEVGNKPTVIVFVKHSSLCMRCFVVPAGVLRDSHSGRGWSFQDLNSFGGTASHSYSFASCSCQQKDQKIPYEITLLRPAIQFAYHRNLDKTPGFWMLLLHKPFDTYQALTFPRY